ncbi:MAG: sporulation protein YqfD [Firmicutes bacterium]|nr:sporulation protein YqfD [Bacillota bacterium]
MKENQFIYSKDKLKLKVEGKRIERFIERVIKKKIPLLKIKKTDRKTIYITIYQKDYDRIQELKTIYHISIVDTYGVSKIKKKVKKNKVLLLSIFFGFLLLVFLSKLIYQVEIIDTDRNVRDFLRKELKEEGVKEYQFKKDYDALEIAKKHILERNHDTIEWLEIETVGTKYVVRVEMRKLPKKEKQPELRNIVSKKNAIIRDVEASQGEIVKRNNDYVKAGDIIISGAIHLNEETKNKVSAEGKVYGEVWYEMQVEFPYHYYNIEKTGRKNTVYVFEYFGKRFELFNRKPFKQKKSDVTSIWKHIMMPIQFKKEKQTEVIETDKVYTKKEAIDQAVKLGIKRMEQKLSKKEKIISVKTLKTEQKKSKMVVDMFFTVYEDITSYAPIPEEVKNEGENAQE